MGKQPFISHSVNGYSRYDMPENKAFSVTPGIIYRCVFSLSMLVIELLCIKVLMVRIASLV